MTMSPRVRRLVHLAVVGLVYAAVVLFVFWRVWTPIHGARRAFVYDAIWEYWGDLQFQVDALARGKLPLWNPYDRCGYPIHADPQAGLLYPLNWPLMALGGLTGSPYWLITVKILVHFWIALVGMHAFLARRKLPLAACFAGACFMILTYPFSHAMFSALNWGVAWTPWMLLALDRWGELPTRRTAAWVSLAFGMSWLSGGPAAFWYALLVSAPYAGWLIVHHRLARRTVLVTAGIAAGLFAFMAAAQLTATAALVEHTVREERDLAFIATSAFSPDDLFGMLVSRMPGEGAYIGILGAFFIGAALVLAPTPRNLVLAATAVFGVLIAWGDSAGFLPASASFLSPFGMFRRAHRYLYVTMVPLAILVAEGMATLAAISSPDVRRRVGRFVVAIGGLGVVVFGVGVVVTSKAPNRPEVFRDAFALAFASVIVSTWILWMVLREGANRRVFLAIAALILTFDIWFARHPTIEKNFTARPVTPNDAHALALPGVPLDARVYDREFLKYRAGIRLHIRDLGGYEGDPLALARYAEFLRRYGADPSRVGHANVKYLLEAGGKAVAKKPGDGKPLRPGIWEVAQVAPAVLWVDKATIVEGGAGASIGALHHVTPGTAAILERPSLRPEEAARAAEGVPGATAAGRIVEADLDRVVAEIDAPADGVVVIAEHVHPGWSATVDGREARIVPANGLFRAVFVEPGHHRIEMRYRAWGFVVLAALSIGAVLAALAVALVVGSRKVLESAPSDGHSGA
jgi:hypothetical protein